MCKLRVSVRGWPFFMLTPQPPEGGLAASKNSQFFPTIKGCKVLFLTVVEKINTLLKSPSGDLGDSFP